MGLFEENIKFTMGASIFIKDLEIDDKEVLLQIWDFGGEEQFRFLLPVYSHGSACGIFMFDLSRYSTIKNVEEWINIFKEGLEEKEQKIPLLMVGGKLDLIEKRVVSKEEALEHAKKNGCFDYIECSSKTGENVGKIFEIIVREVMRRLEIP
jgi:small GTP-binding protein